MKRYGTVIQVKPGKLDEYKKLHAAAWPSVLEQIRQSNSRYYSIFYKDGLLFCYFEYIGVDYEKDMAAMAEDAVAQQWWALCKPCQQPIATSLGGEWWASMEEVFYAN